MPGLRSLRIIPGRNAGLSAKQSQGRNAWATNPVVLNPQGEESKYRMTIPGYKSCQSEPAKYKMTIPGRNARAF